MAPGDVGEKQELRKRSASVDTVDVCAFHMALSLLPKPNYDTKRGKQPCAGCQDGG